MCSNELTDAENELTTAEVRVRANNLLVGAGRRSALPAESVEDPIPAMPTDAASSSSSATDTGPSVSFAAFQEMILRGEVNWMGLNIEPPHGTRIVASTDTRTLRTRHELAKNAILAAASFFQTYGGEDKEYRLYQLYLAAQGVKIDGFKLGLSILYTAAKAKDNGEISNGSEYIYLASKVYYLYPDVPRLPDRVKSSEGSFEIVKENGTTHYRVVVAEPKINERFAYSACEKNEALRAFRAIFEEQQGETVALCLKDNCRIYTSEGGGYFRCIKKVLWTRVPEEIIILVEPYYGRYQFDGYILVHSSGPRLHRLIKEAFNEEEILVGEEIDHKHGIRSCNKLKYLDQTSNNRDTDRKFPQRELSVGEFSHFLTLE